MKIRNGFVSNSSSSSFVIIIHEDKVKTCPTCNHSNSHDLAIVQHSNIDDWGGESCIQSLVDSEAYKNLWEHYEDTKEAVDRLSYRREDEIPYWFETGEKDRENAYKGYLLEMLKEIKGDISLYEETIKNKKSFHLKISSHDTILKTAFENLVAAGVVELVLEEDE